MANSLQFLLLLCFTIPITIQSARHLSDPTMLFTYHKGPLLTAPLQINLIFYGSFSPSQISIVSDFISSLSSPSSVSNWWKSTHQYFLLAKSPTPSPISLGKQLLDPRYSLGKTLNSAQIRRLATRSVKSKSLNSNSISVVLTSNDVVVDNFCRSTCGNHGLLKKHVPYIWVGNSATQCPGLCAWPYHQPIYGPQGPPLVAPNNDVGVDGMIINLAGLLAGTVTNPYGNGYYQGPREAPLEAASACPGVYGKGAYPGYPGDLLVDTITGGSYNVKGVNGRKYLVPALYNPATSMCSTGLV